MSDHPLCNVVEAVLMAAGRPVTIDQMLELFDEHERPAAADLRDALADLDRRFEGTGIEVREVSSGWRVQVRQQYSGTVSRLWQERPSRYSRALLETLSLIAYRQPITRGEIEDIRGVTVASTIMRTIQERGWIRVVGHREVPGHPELLGTTREFLDYFGLKSLDDLPTLAQLQDLEDINEQLELPGAPELPAPSAANADSAEADPLPGVEPSLDGEQSPEVEPPSVQVELSSDDQPPPGNESR
ncbi:MAG: SMC-Scp complex subunit ScpB [Steroidobacteraceae bacterium]|nr:SMC-Scp complex subunit ScpB [Steroidobacteraceae bacterium]